MDKWVHQKKQWLEQYLAPLVGCTITAVRVKIEDDQCWPVVVAQPILSRTPNKEKVVYELEISRDPEGNGPGWVFGLPRPETKDG